MSTKAEQFASKIRYLQEYHNRVLHNIYPVPSGTDIANTLKYFSQTLLRPQASSINPTVTRSLLYSVLRDAPSERGQQSRDAQLSEYPSLDYQGLYVTLVTLLDLVPLLQHGQHDLGQSIFYTTTCLLPFLSDDILSTLPYTMISTLATFPPFLHKDIIEYLSTSFLPMAIRSSRRESGVPAHVNLSASSMLMIAMQYTSNPVYHCQLLECLMKYKQEVWKDLLYVIAYGPSQVKPPAVQMLFHYWPNLKPPGAISEYRGLQYTAWNPIHCQHIECHNAINKPAVKMCIDASLSVALGDKPPPLYLCEECSQRITGDHSEWLIDVLLPQAEISAICQKKNCSSHVRRAVVTCFSSECCDRHGNRPVRYCKRCHSYHHSSEVGAAAAAAPAETHLYQTSPPPINTRECGAEELVCAVEAVISLLKEAEFHAEQREYELNRRRQMGLSSSHHSLDNTDFDNKDDDKHDQRLLSQFGIWFLVSLCTPSENTPTESLARLVSMVFQWFHSTAYMMDDEVGSLVEKLKPQFVTKWLKTVCDIRFDVMVMCLLPKPMEFARVGGYWDKSCSTVTQLKEGLNRLLCLIPYNVINQPVWECIMPEWLEAIRLEVPDNHLKEFREVLSKMFDIELCPLPFTMEEMFSFISCRFTGYPSSVQEQALLWLHVLSELDIVVPLELLIGMFADGVNSVKELANQRKTRVSELAGNLTAQRGSIASDPGRRAQHGMLSPFPSPFQSPFRSPMRSPFRSPFKNIGHAAGRTIDFDCDDEEMNLNCFILMFDLILKQMELQDDGITMGLENILSKDIISIINNVFQAPWGGSHTCQKDEKAVECNLCQSSILCYQLACELLERLAPKIEIRLVEPTDSLEEGLLFTRAEFTIGEGEEEENSTAKHGENPGNHTAVPENTAVKNDTERKFCYQQLPVTLKLIYTILQEMAKFEEPDILFNMLNCLKILCLNGECLYLAKKDQPQFLAYIQEHLLIASLWRVLKSDFSQLSSLGVPLLLHALSLPYGADIFWTIINTNFNSKDWKMRFEAVEKVAVLCRFLDIHSVTKNHLLKYSLAHAFCCFLTAVEDVNPAVATRAGLLLDTIKRPALQGLCLCLDFQFDTVVKDRPTILSKLLLLHFLKQDIPALSWEFFVNRFETLSLEAQLHLDCNKEFPFPTTITAVRTNVANLSDAAMWKIKRARFARNRQKSVRSLRDSVKGPLESKRAHSLPETLNTKIPVRLTRHEQSAPALGETADQTPGQHSPENENIIKDLLPEDAGIDHQTVHQLIMVLMKFMAKDQSSAETDISSAKAFNTVKRHLYVLLGYDQQEGCFMIAPQKMRISTCFNAFIAGIAQVMDYNINLGKHLLPLVVQVLKYCTCPQLRHHFQQPPRCSLWSLKPHIRQMWLKALLVILYKYPYMDPELGKIMLHLIYITVNTLNAQYHSCKPHATAGPLYSDNSNISRYSEKEKEEDSVFDESDVHDTPTGAGNKESQTFFARLKRIGGSKMVKYHQVDMNAQRSEIELAENRESGALQDSILRCVREETIQKKRLRSLKQKSLDIGNSDSLLFSLDEHRRKSCIDRCDLIHPTTATYSANRQNDYGRSRQNSTNKVEHTEIHVTPPTRDHFQEIRRPVIPEVRLSCMETFEVKIDSPVKPSTHREDVDLIDLSSDSTSGPEKQSILSTSDSDSLVFEPLPPLRIVESDDEDFDVISQLNDGISVKMIISSPSSPISASALSLSLIPLVHVSIEDCSKDFSSKDLSHNQVSRKEDVSFPTPENQTDLEELAKPEEIQDMPSGSPLTLKQKRDQLRKSNALHDTSIDDDCELEEAKTPDEEGSDAEVKAAQPEVPEDSENQTDSEKPDPGMESDTEQNVEQKEEAEESEFKIQIVPRQRKQRKIAVSAIQREYLDITFNILDKLGEQKAAEPAEKSTAVLEMPKESSSAPTLEAGIPETSSHSSLTKEQKAAHEVLGSISEVSMGRTSIPYIQIGATKSSLLSAPSIVSMFVPAPEEFSDDQPTVMTDKCHDCGAILEEYDEETLGLAVVVLSTFIHLSPDLAAPLLLDIMQSVGRLASSTSFSNQAESMMIPGNAAGVAKQFLRCIFHQLAPNGILPQLFQSNIKDGSFLRTLASSLMDFNELSSIAALSQLLEGLNNKKNLPAGGAMLRCLENIATFMEALPMDTPSNLWTTICNQFQTFFTKLPSVLPLKCSLDSSLRLMICLLKIPTTSATRSLLEPFSKLLSFVLQNAVFTLAYLVELCGLCYRAFAKERDKFYLTRSVILDLLQALKLKVPLPDTNLLLLIQFICADVGTKLAESTILNKQMIACVPGCGTAAMECMRQYISELLDFIADMHTLTKLKKQRHFFGDVRLLILSSHMKTCSQPLHEDTFGGHLKVGLAQIASMEITRGNHRDNKAVVRYLPWLYHPPSAMQQGPKEFIECVTHIRLLSWLLLGSLTHSVVCLNSPSSCMPIPLDAGSQIADHLIVILIGFPEQSKTSVLHMCSLFHAFIFAQLWTVYCEQAAVAPSIQNQTEFSFTAILTALEFWSRVTPSILQLMAHNKVMVEMVCLHVISLMEALQECNSTIFVKLIAMWLPMIQSNLKNLSAGLQLRLQAIQNNVHHHSLRMLQGSGQISHNAAVLRKWLQCTQFKMAQVEIQSSEAASQFYPL
ncbi:protein unc-79 homolog isoform X6 [Ambystoma mexicanum]|uniref:protein unc-79 homolog isoform X6 n=1 Tax=Ambystoma mexicanum TaxID=8296 RepID=UPI0037E94158